MRQGNRTPQPDQPGVLVSADLILDNADLVLTCAGGAPKRGPAQGDVRPLTRASVAARAGRIVFVGSAGECARAVPRAADTRVIDATGCTVIPGFVDAHTHVVFAGDRRGELQRRLAGATYAQIAAEGGGILRTVHATRAASEASLVEQTSRRLDDMLRCGTTTCEVKSGYGLTADSELKMLRAIRELDRRHPVDLVPTFMGAHEVAPEYRGRRSAYVELLTREMIPEVGRAGLAEWCDVFCETGVFTPDESRAILGAGRQAGLKSRVHADELAASGGAFVAAAVGARSADHLIFIEVEGARALARAGVVATLLPAAAFYLKIGRYAPARMLIDAGVPVALATDMNPGGGFSPSMPFVVTLACFAMGMTLDEALVAATINAAYALDRHETVGSLEPGKWLDAVVVAGDPTDLLRTERNAVRLVVKKGQVVAES